MLLSAFCSSRKRTARRVVAGAIGAGAISSAMLLGTSPLAFADPPNCTAADLAGVSAGVAAATSAYLFTHPDVNAFFTSLKGQPKSEIKDDVQRYMDDNPTVKGELQNIRQPLVDLKNRCQQ